ncbi:MAG: MBL fold metallo-hydrolase [Paludibacteraceae bacterium]|nr:MBL fold metallo-hydrolase [Paludibacteraceae bacterium]
MKIEQFTFGPFGTNTYVLADEEGKVLLIDPACFYEQERQELYQTITRLHQPDQPLTIVATHGHLDHLWGAKWATETWHTPVRMHEADIPMAQAMQQQYDLFGLGLKAERFEIEEFRSQDSEFRVQNSEFRFQIIHTPGHTQGSVCLYFPEERKLFSGDTLFRCGYGRTDLPGGNYGQLISSLEQLMTLPPETEVFPGHGESTTIGYERR